MPYRSVNPATGEVLKTFPEHTDQQMWSAWPLSSLGIEEFVNSKLIFVPNGHS